MKNVLNFILGLLAMIYIIVFVLNFTGIIDLHGLLGGYYFELIFIIIIPIFLLGAFALVAFASKSFKLVFFILTVIALAVVIVILIDPTLFGLIESPFSL